MQSRCVYYCTHFMSLQSITLCCITTESLKTFILNIKQAVPISPESSIKFVKRGTKVLHKRTPPVDILHQASDWVLLTNLDANYCFSIHIAFTQLRPDITIFSNALRQVILVELTCPCEENLESWHSTKILVLRDIALSLFCVVSKSQLLIILLRNNIIKFSKSSMECSFCIWLARNNKEWTPTTKFKVRDSLKETYYSPSPGPHLKQNIKPVLKAN